jgi:hypothetical protein
MSEQCVCVLKIEKKERKTFRSKVLKKEPSKSIKFEEHSFCFLYIFFCSGWLFLSPALESAEKDGAEMSPRDKHC